MKTKYDKYESPVVSEDIEIAKNRRAKTLSSGNERSAEINSKRRYVISPESEKIDDGSQQLDEDEEECMSITKETPLSLDSMGAQVELGPFRRIQGSQQNATQVAHSSGETSARNEYKKLKSSKWSLSPSGSNLNHQRPSRTYLSPIDDHNDLDAATSLLNKVTADYQNAIAPLLIENEALRQSIKTLEEKYTTDGEEILSLRDKLNRA